MRLYVIRPRNLVVLGAFLLGLASIGCGEEPGGGIAAPPTPEPAVATPQSTVTEGPEVAPPAGFPTDLVYPGSLGRRAATTPNELHLASTTSDPVGRVVRFYQEALPRAEFQPVTVMTPDSLTTIVTAANGPRVFSATIRSDVSGTTTVELAHKLQEEM